MKCSNKNKAAKKKEKLNKDKVCFNCGNKLEDVSGKVKFCGDYCRYNYHLNKTIYKDSENYYEQILKDTGLNIPIKTTNDFIDWIKSNFFLLGLKTIHSSENKIAAETYLGRTFVVEVRYFGAEDFSGLSFIKDSKSKSRAFFVLGNPIKISLFFKGILSAQANYFGQF